MSAVNLRGQQQWEGFHVLCRPPELAHIDRRFFGLIFVLLAVLWQGVGSFLLGLAAAVGAYVGCRVMTWRDPHFFTVLRLSSRYDIAWADPGAPPETYGAYLLDVPVEQLRAGESGPEGAR